MLPYLESLLASFEAADSYDAPEIKAEGVAPGEEVLGTMSVSLQKIWWVYITVRKSFDNEYKVFGKKYQQIINRPRSKSSNEDIEFAMLCMIKIRRCEEMERLFYRCVEEEFPRILVDYRRIGIRDGGQIVFEKEEQPKKLVASFHSDPFGANKPGPKGDMHEYGMPSPYKLH